MKKFVFLLIGLLFISTSTLASSFDADVGQETKMIADYDQLFIEVSAVAFEATKSHEYLYTQIADERRSFKMIYLTTTENQNLFVDSKTKLVFAHIDPGWCDLMLI